MHTPHSGGAAVRDWRRLAPRRLRCAAPVVVLLVALASATHPSVASAAAIDDVLDNQVAAQQFVETDAGQNAPCEAACTQLQNDLQQLNPDDPAAQDLLWELEDLEQQTRAAPNWLEWLDERAPEIALATADVGVWVLVYDEYKRLETPVDDGYPAEWNPGATLVPPGSAAESTEANPHGIPITRWSWELTNNGWPYEESQTWYCDGSVAPTIFPTIPAMWTRYVGWIYPRSSNPCNEGYSYIQAKSTVFLTPAKLAPTVDAASHPGIKPTLTVGGNGVPDSTEEQAIRDFLRDHPGDYTLLTAWLAHELAPRCNPDPLSSAAPPIPAIDPGETEDHYVGCLETLGVVDDVANAISDKNPNTLKDDPDRDAKIKLVTRECLWRTAASATDGKASSDECTRLPMFVPGRDVPSATDTDIAALDDPRYGHPAWVKLTYRDVGPNDGWYTQYPETGKTTGTCKGTIVAYPLTDPHNTACHEYPYWATAQGGDHPEPNRPFLRIINWLDNSNEGGKFGTFVTTCKMADRLADSEPTSRYGNGNFLVIPIPAGASLDTTWFCGANPPQ